MAVPNDSVNIHLERKIAPKMRVGRQTAAAREPEPTVSENVAAGITDAIDDLEAEPDARRAVIAAYARMEGVLGRNGFLRVPSETAIEYLRRVLLGLTSRGDAVTQLTALFEQAKFSQNEIDARGEMEGNVRLR